MAILDEHFQQLKTDGQRRGFFADASLTAHGNGTTVVKLSDYVLPKGWTPAKTNIFFVVPVSYPVARPDTFWANPKLQLIAGGVPANTGNNQAEGIPSDSMWFSWHPASWNSNRDNLVNYVAMIRRRLEDAR